MDNILFLIAMTKIANTKIIVREAIKNILTKVMRK